MNETFKLGAFGYCVGSTCSNTSLGYEIDLGTLLGLTGTVATEVNDLIGDQVSKGLTYVLVAIPIAAGLGLLAFLLGLVAHIRECGGTCLTTFVASLGSTIGLIAFVFQLVVTIILKKRIESSSVGGTASFGNAIWLTLVGSLCLTFSSCFFCCGRRLIKNRPPRRDVEDDLSRRQKHASDSESLVAQKARYGNYGRDASGSNLPAFAELHGDEAVPLNSLSNQYQEDDIGYQHGAGMQGYDSRQSVVSGTHLTGVGQGYGRREDRRQASVDSQGAYQSQVEQQYNAGYVQSPTSPTRSQPQPWAAPPPAHQDTYASYSPGAGYQSAPYATPYDPPTAHSQYAEPLPHQGSLPLPVRSPSPQPSMPFSQAAPTYYTHQDEPYAGHEYSSYPPQGQVPYDPYGQQHYGQQHSGY